MEAGLTLSIVVPTRGEAEGIEAFLRHLRERAPDAEVIVADGGSTDGTPELARPLADRVVQSAPGRARQMNAGAGAASGELLWFVHADSRLPERSAAALAEALRDPRLAGGCFRLRIPRPEPVYRISDRLGNLGVDLFRIALGDHGIFCRRAVFAAVGGYPDVPLMEDAELYRRLRKHGRVRQLPLEIETSPRRYERHGPYRTTALYALILALYAAHVPLPLLARIYARLT
ncbi:MAG: TIGR04283 family arsenosugar biosynthesis glycosyltransferase [Armatimonadota bacterium]